MWFLFQVVDDNEQKHQQNNCLFLNNGFRQKNRGINSVYPVDLFTHHIQS